MKNKHQSKYCEIDLSKLKTFPMSDLDRKVQQGEFASPMEGNATLSGLIDSFPDILAAKELKAFTRILADAFRERKTVIVMFGGHVIKTGLAPLLINWLKRGFISCLATHGAGVIHDTEIAMFGRTSEDVAAGLADGRFGMSRDTANLINGAIAAPENCELGYGEALGKTLIDAAAPCGDLSLAYNSYKVNVPLTVHVAVGTDIIHQHPTADGEAIGRASLRDFRIFASQVSKLSEGSVVINIGSAVIMPEVFLKALSVARNLENPAHGFNTANFDMITHYRPMQNVLKRPTMTGGRNFNFTGHHEIMIPLLFAMVDHQLSSQN